MHTYLDMNDSLKICYYNNALILDMDVIQQFK